MAWDSARNIVRSDVDVPDLVQDTTESAFEVGSTTRPAPLGQGLTVDGVEPEPGVRLRGDLPQQRRALPRDQPALRHALILKPDDLEVESLLPLVQPPRAWVMSNLSSATVASHVLDTTSRLSPALSDLDLRAAGSTRGFRTNTIGRTLPSPGCVNQRRRTRSPAQHRRSHRSVVKWHGQEPYDRDSR